MNTVPELTGTRAAYRLRITEGEATDELGVVTCFGHKNTVD